MSIAEHAWEDIEGLDVFTTDDQHIGVVEHVVVDPDDPTQHFILMGSSELGALFGTQKLYVPDGDVNRIEADRVILALASDEIGRFDWTTPPTGFNPSSSD